MARSGSLIAWEYAEPAKVMSQRHPPPRSYCCSFRVFFAGRASESKVPSLWALQLSSLRLQHLPGTRARPLGREGGSIGDRIDGTR